MSRLSWTNRKGCCETEAASEKGKRDTVTLRHPAPLEVRSWYIIRITAMDKLAYEGKNPMKFPSAAIRDDSLDFSFSGIKTAVLNTLNQMSQKGEEIPRADIAAGFTKAAVSSVTTKLGMAFDRNPDMKALVLAGGVAANSHLRTALEQFTKKRGISLYMPELCYCGDNAAMIGAAAFFEWDAGNLADVSLNAYAYSV